MPTITITRDATAILLGKPSPPLKIILTFNLNNNSVGPTTEQISFGYNASPGGNIPNHFEATLGGLTGGFNPLTATVDTIGGIGGLSIGAMPSPTYIGPLTLLATIAPVGGRRPI